MTAGSNLQKTGPAAALATLECAAVVCVHFAAHSRLHVAPPLHIVFCLLFMASWLATATHRGLWSYHALLDIRALAPALIRAGGCTIVCSVIGLFLFTSTADGLEYLAVVTAGSMAAILSTRAIWKLAASCLNTIGVIKRHALIVGANERTRRLARTLARRGHVEGVVDDNAEHAATIDAPYLGPMAALDLVLITNKIGEVFVGLDPDTQHPIVERAIRVAEAHGTPVHVCAEFFCLRWARKKAHFVGDIPLLGITTVPDNRLLLAIKRTIDVGGALLLLIVLAPAFLTVAALIKLDSRGPVLFSQERIGRNRRRFRMLKFRSMVYNAQNMRSQLETLNESSGPVFKIKCDPRVTRFGAFMRKHSIDEFPQLLNVLRGDMSLVGPRPPLPHEVAHYTWQQRRRLSIKPGMTGLWQVSGRNAIDFTDWVKLDLQYIDQWSLWLDFLILIKTIREVIEGRNAA